jgi:quinoprotein glucose dehydrogenase
MNTDERLFALDAKSGKPVPTFGQDGVASLTADLVRPIKPRHTSQTSPPVVFKNLVIVGSRVPDRLAYSGDTPGTVQAFDARTGKRAWVFYTTPQSADDPAAATWEKESWKTAGHANVWGPMSLDDTRGLLFVPVSTASGDYWGGRRLGKNLYAESLVTLDANTGKVKWYFQAVHHGLWDYDFCSAPNLLTITVNGRKIDAVALVSKQGFTYVFDRVTGKPVWPIEERSVETYTDVPGEKPWATQPIPTKPPPFAVQGVSLDDANDLTPEVKALAIAEMSKYKLGGLFTPPSLQGTLQRPMNNGGANWPGAGVDPESGVMYVKVSEGTLISGLCKNDGSDPDIDVEYINNCENGASANIFPGRAGRGNESESAATRNLLGPIPLIKPPYGTLVAINLNRGEIVWRVPVGEGSQTIREHPLLKGVKLPDRLGSSGQAGVLITRNGLVFTGAGEAYLYAFDKATGQELWRVPTPYRTGGLPMTYKTRSGRQFIAIATGGGPDATLVAFALGSERPTTTAASGPATQQTAQTGSAAYAKVCQACHGENGAGGAGPALVPMTRDAAQVLSIVRDGLGQMPPISTRELSDDDVTRIVEHLRSRR